MVVHGRYRRNLYTPITLAFTPLVTSPGTHEELIRRVKGYAEDGRVMTAQSLLLAAVRHLHYLHQEVARKQNPKISTLFSAPVHSYRSRRSF